MIELSHDERAMIYAAIALAIEQGWAGAPRETILRDIMKKMVEQPVHGNV